MSLQPQELVANRYQIERSLEVAQLSETYLAFDQEQHKQVIVKELKLRQLDQWKTHERFEREARVLQSLQHSGVPKWLDYFQDDLGGRLFLIIEHIQGQTWLERMEQGWHPATEIVFDLIEQSLDILDYLHGLNPPIVHRDLKPSNLMLNPQGKVHLIDFGAVQDVLHPEGGKTVMGTFGYMAPEQFSGKAEPASDLYGLGMSLIHVLSGKRPSDLPQSGQRLLFEEYIQAPPALLTWLKNMTAPQLAQRYRSAKEARQSLKQLRQGKTATLPELHHGSTASVTDTTKTLLATLAVLGLAGLGGLTYWSTQGNNEQPRVYQGPCFAEPYALPAADQRLDAQELSADFERQFAKPEWWHDVDAPVFGHLEPFLKFWRCQQRASDRVFFKAAFQSILDHPRNDALVVTALNLIPYGDPDYPQLIPLLEYGVDNYFYDRVNGLGGTADRIGGIVEKLTREYNRAKQFSQSVTLLERFMRQRGKELNPHMFQLISLEYAQALWKTNKKPEALYVIDKALQAQGDWVHKLVALKSKIESS